MKISKGMKLIGVCIGAAGILMIVVLIAFIAFMAYAGSDALSGNAIGSELLTPGGEVIGKALVVYNPGLSGAPKDAATLIANDLKSRGYEVMLAGVNSTASKNVSCYDVIVAGGPIYGGKVSPSIQSYLQALDPPVNAKVGAFAIGGSDGKAFPDAPYLKATALMKTDKDMNAQVSAFVSDLLDKAIT